MNPQTLQPVPTPWPSLRIPFPTQEDRHEALPNRSLQLDAAAAHKARQLKQAEWSTLVLRQSFADEGFMRAHLVAAGLRIKDNTEPATVPRLRSLLRRVGIKGPEFEAATGTDPAGFLALNPALPLWASVALVLESSGRFTNAARASA